MGNQWEGKEAARCRNMAQKTLSLLQAIDKNNQA